MRWTTKAFIQRAIGVIPYGEHAYHLAQRHVGALRDYKIDNKVKNGLDLLEGLYAVGDDVQARDTLEIGTGWIPVLPMLFWLFGQRSCKTYDVSRLLVPSMLVEAGRQLLDLAANPQSVLGGRPYLGTRLDADRLQQLRKAMGDDPSGRRLLERTGISYKAPGDAAVSGLPDASVDVVFSNTVLEHVPEHDLNRLYREAFRILRSGGCMLHLIDLSDHYSYSDPSITGINFFQFSGAEFAKYNNKFLFQNRIPAGRHRQIIEACGFEIAYWKTNFDRRAASQYGQLKLHQDYAGIPPEDLCIGSIRVVARRL